MARSDDLLAAGITYDLGNGTHHGFNIQLQIPIQIIDDYPIFELFAKEFGWTEESPETSVEKSISIMRNFAWDVLTEALIRQNINIAREQVLETIKQAKEISNGI